MSEQLAKSTPGEATLSTDLNPVCGQALEQAHTLLDACHAPTKSWKLPTEINLAIMAKMDPVSQMCLGLTCHSLHQAFHTIYGAVGGEDTVDEHWPTWRHQIARKYNIKERPFVLTMQASVCGEAIINWWYDEDFKREGFEWHRSLWELIMDEKTLWADLSCCPGCFIYKPDSAYAGFAWEDEMLQKHSAVAWSDWDEYRDCCRRCRAKMILVELEQKEELLGGNAWESSLGLIRYPNLVDADDRHATVHDYQSWKELYSELGI